MLITDSIFVGGEKYVLKYFQQNSSLKNIERINKIKRKNTHLSFRIDLPRRETRCTQQMPAGFDPNVLVVFGTNFTQLKGASCKW